MTRAIFPLLSATALLLASPVQATGFQDLGTCFTARKGMAKVIDDLGKCEVHFYSGSGSGTGLRLLFPSGHKVVAICPGNSTETGTWRPLTQEEASTCQVNGELGTVKWIRSGSGSAYCAWRHRDSIAYCGRPWNVRQ